VEIGGKHIHLLLLERGLKMLGVQVNTSYYVRKKGFSELCIRGLLKLLPENLKYEVMYRDRIGYLEKNALSEDVDLVHAHDAPALLATRSMPQKKILTVHGYFARENIGHPQQIKNRAKVKAYYTLLEFERESLNYADYIITVDTRLKEYLVSELGYPEDRITVIYNAIDTDKFQPVSLEEQKKLKKDLGYPENDFVILAPRRLVQKNGVIYAVKAMKYLKENFTLIIAGDGPERENIVSEAKKDKRIHLVGSIPHRDIDVYYKGADAVLVPSITSNEIQEASSLAMLEGMACGKIVVCSDIGGMREIVKNMENGILVKERDPLDIARAIQIAIQDPKLRDAISNNARAEVVKDHSYLAHAKKTLDIYRNVLGRRDEDA
jgi:glycosyltransferase involved in cell wall biosynthesis